MSYLFKLIRQNQINYLANRATNINNLHVLKNNVGLYHRVSCSPLATSTPRFMASTQTPPPPPPNPDSSREKLKKKPDDIEYVVRFQQPIDVKKIFKDFYSVYGPLFVVCHIGVSLFSLGCFCSLVWLTVDPIKYMPDWLTTMIGQKLMGMTGEGSKFVVAYALHKIILPIRLLGAIWLTRSLSTIWKAKMKKK